MTQGTNLSPDTIRHLSFARSLYLHGLQHSNSDNVLDRAIAIMNFDGSVETFLYALVDFLGAEVKERPKYNELIDAVRSNVENPALIEELKLINMHFARNNAQHHGMIASFSDVQQYKELTYLTLAKLSKDILKIDFEEISLSELIHNGLVKSLYKKAESACSSGNYKDALFFTACAFEKAKREEQNELWGSLISLHRISSPLNRDKLMNAIIEEIEILKLRLDYKQYQKYREIFHFELLPFSNITANSEEGIERSVKGKLNETIKDWNSETNELKTDAVFCLSFALYYILLWESLERTDLSDLLALIFKPFQSEKE